MAKDELDAIFERMSGAQPRLEHALGHIANVVLGLSSFMEETAESDDAPDDLSNYVLDLPFEAAMLLNALGYADTQVEDTAPKGNRKARRAMAAQERKVDSQ